MDFSLANLFSGSSWIWSTVAHTVRTICHSKDARITRSMPRCVASPKRIEWSFSHVADVGRILNLSRRICFAWKSWPPKVGFSTIVGRRVCLLSRILLKMVYDLPSGSSTRLLQIDYNRSYSYKISDFRKFFIRDDLRKVKKKSKEIFKRRLPLEEIRNLDGQSGRLSVVLCALSVCIDESQLFKLIGIFKLSG